MESVKEVKNKIRELYWEKQGNCAHAMLHCLGELMQIELDAQVFASVAGLHGAEKLGAHCGLALAGQMFIAIYDRQANRDEASVIAHCTRYAEVFRNTFTTLVCRELRLNGYRSTDPRHCCEQLTCDAITVTYNFLQRSDII